MTTIHSNQRPSNKYTPLVYEFEKISRNDVNIVGGKNASLGEMIRELGNEGVAVPPGFATTSQCYWEFLHYNNINERLEELIRDWQARKISLAETGRCARDLFLKAEWPKEAKETISSAYDSLSKKVGIVSVDVAVRSSATAEDFPEASFAGQQDTFLNISGKSALFQACQRCYASLFTDRAISYRQTRGFDQLKVALSIGVQQMVRSDLSGSGVMFSIDTESGFEKIVLINAAWGLGENVVQGAVNPDEYQISKPFLNETGLIPIIEKRLGGKERKMVYSEGESATRNVPTSRSEQDVLVLDDVEIIQLGRWACTVERHYGYPVDMEWAKDGITNQLFIVLARPETVHSVRRVGEFHEYSVKAKGKTLATGCSVGNAAVAGRVCMIGSPTDIDTFIEGSILVTETTDPDWVPIMKKALAIVTDHGGRTSHAAIVSRELGITAVVGTSNATYVLHTGKDITVSCAEGETGYVYEGIADITSESIDVSKLPATSTRVMLNLADPSAANRWWRLPCDGIGLARMEFVWNNHVRIHPMALLHPDRITDEATQQKINKLTTGYEDKSQYFVDKLALGLARLCALVYPKPAIIRLSDFKTNEYANLIGGSSFEPKEENPMIGWRGASRYYSSAYKDGFSLECRAIKRLRYEIGFMNAVVMVPFCRTIQEAIKVQNELSRHGLRRGADDLQIYVMCEIPSNVILAQEFANHFDGFSIGSNDLTQLVLGIDRDSGELSSLFSEKDDAVKWMIAEAIAKAHKAKRKIGLCGQAPSNDPSFASFLVKCGIDSISVTPSSFIAVKLNIADAEHENRETLFRM
ncbi:phosphoenolpyruvate synthase [Aaosphaeria arxii CBS 175.79]|uniref:pyruvate, water dikinase n=1 Tax=Aaosphaeria arxii CBS 175.79 TaxID=1450172 RepID=A0A6A5X8H5_9PLEO|nr:phosphoenolpyruvate synthase [Aaosphaeria arxii CBS 175.79]KAF2009355.1 phosphoenolpyruvate synthase [Aaosphaeria arxii CBS 175.79]